MIPSLPTLLVLVPLLGALGCVSLPATPRHLASALGILMMLLLSAYGLHLHLSSAVLIESATLMGLGLRLDGLALVFVLMTSAIAALCSLQARLYFDQQRDALAAFWPLFWLLWAGLNGVWLSRDLFSLYLSMEVLALAATLLMSLRGQKNSFGAALRYLQAVLLGTLLFFIGALLVFIDLGSLALQDLNQQWGQMGRLGLALITVGLLYRAALFPLHTWLPPAHGSAHAPISALLSALVTKASFYILLRIWLNGGAAVSTVAAAQFLGALGAIAIIWGGWMACRQRELKPLVAYSSVNQVGYFFLFFPLIVGTSASVTALASQAAVLQLLSHAFAKAAVFLAIGNLIVATGSNRVSGLSGISSAMPLSLFSFGLAGVSLMGLPPSGGFMAKWTFVQAMVASGQWWWIAVIIGGGLLSAAYVFRIFRQSFFPRGDRPALKPTPLSSDVAPFVLACLSVGLGLVSLWPLSLAFDLQLTGVSAALVGGVA